MKWALVDRVHILWQDHLEEVIRDAIVSTATSPYTVNKLVTIDSGANEVPTWLQSVSDVLEVGPKHFFRVKQVVNCKLG